MRIAIVDTTESERAKLRDVCARWGQDRPDQPSIETFPDSEAFLNAWHARLFDLVIIDCELAQERGGIKLAKTMRKHNDDTVVVLVSRTPQYALEGYEVGAAGYLLKPISEVKLSATLDRVLPAHLINSVNEPVRLSAQGLELLLEPRTVVMVQAHNHYVDLLFSSGREIRVRKSFSSLREALCGVGPFFQSTRGILVNLSYVRSIDGAAFILFNGRSAPISKANMREARMTYEAYILSQAGKGSTRK